MRIDFVAGGAIDQWRLPFICCLADIDHRYMAAEVSSAV